MPTLTKFVATGLGGLLLIPLLAVTSGGTTPACPPAVPSAPPVAAGAAAQTTPAWDTSQHAIAAIIVAVGQAKGVPPWGWIVALATAMQESTLRNLPGGDADSIGVFQQRPSQGWGTPTQLASPTYQAGKFYDALLTIPDWQHLPLTQAAQAVQRSAFPNAYAKWTTPATQLLAQLRPGTPPDAPGLMASTTPGCRVGGGDALTSRGSATLPPGVPLPTRTPAATATPTRVP